MRESNNPLPGGALVAIAGTVVLCVALIGLAVYFSVKNSGSDQKQAAQSLADHMSKDKLDITTTPTWVPNYTNLPRTLETLKLPAAGSTLHHHVHLDLAIEGRSVQLPAQIGLATTAESPLHTHDASGVIHIESASPDFAPVLGEVFDVWGVYLSSTAIGGYSNAGTSTLTAYLNGKAYTGDPTQLPLHDHDEILLSYGTPDRLPTTIPASYTFPEGL